MCMVHSPLRDATTPYTERCVQSKINAYENLDLLIYPYSTDYLL